MGCVGTETRLIDCPNAGGLGVHNCAHTEDAGVRCVGTSHVGILQWLVVTVQIYT